MILTASKLTAMQLNGFACREYLADRPMTAQRLIDHVLPVKGRREISVGSNGRSLNPADGLAG